eukprot:TRINITY_DN3359_c0_g1::TRINITY_DN3359_c0_g1_i1::g.31009::m.31009 TRINITY_DN3359_c0_g1::TRINITY_DN3359_c0_g1_i1::g.31009  ORF type:complete len:105 (-),score=-1.02,Peptidase_S64/PF08192.6/0.25 TRINITY_DN3359_c0_g1_i1:308-622(-)
MRRKRLIISESVSSGSTQVMKPAKSSYSHTVLSERSSLRGCALSPGVPSAPETARTSSEPTPDLSPSPLSLSMSISKAMSMPSSTVGGVLVPLWSCESPARRER